MKHSVQLEDAKASRLYRNKNAVSSGLLDRSRRGAEIWGKVQVGVG